MVSPTNLEVEKIFEIKSAGGQKVAKSNCYWKPRRWQKYVFKKTQGCNRASVILPG